MTLLLDLQTATAGDENAPVGWALHRELMPELPVVLRLVMDGEPVSKARSRFTGRGSKARPYTPERTREAEETLQQLARIAGLSEPPDGSHSFGLFAKFFCSTWQRRDVDNMLKLVSDALTGLVWVDDAQVSEMSASVQRGCDDPRTHILVYQTIAALPPTRPCEWCGSPVRQYKSQPNRFCSREHASLGAQVRTQLQCVECGRAYGLPAARAARVKTPICSEGCRYAHRVIEAACAQCGTPIRRPRSQVKAAVYCGVACANAAKVGRSVRASS